MSSLNEDRPIGIFDSGVGGLTVTRSVAELLPQENIIYFGDTARCPYGSRSISEVRQFALEIADLLIAQEVKVLVVACNAMSSAALDELSRRSDVPVLGVITPGVRAAVRATRNGQVGVLATAVTALSGSYEKAASQEEHEVRVRVQACPGLVEYVERGDWFSEELVALAESYVLPLLEEGVDTLVLGCTHYPLLRGVLHWVTKGGVLLISSADEVAKDLYSVLVETKLLSRTLDPGHRRFFCSGDPREFRRVGRRFLPELDEVGQLGVLVP